MQQKSIAPEQTSHHGVKNICVYCGSGMGENPRYRVAARTLGRSLAEHGIGLVYGGGGLGLMGEVARATLDHGGRVTGIIPIFLSQREHMLREADELIVTDDMHQRKRLMFERSDAFVALPGGIGTLEELVEQLTWSQLGRHEKPILLANVENYWDPFIKLIDEMRREGFVRCDLDVDFLVEVDAKKIVSRVLAAASRSDTPAVARNITRRM